MKKSPAAAGLRISFQAKVLVPVIAILILLMAITTWVANRRISQQLETEGLQRLGTSEAVLKTFQTIHSDNFRSRYQNLANEPSLKAVALLRDPKTLEDYFKDKIQDLNLQNAGADIVLFSSENSETKPHVLFHNSVNIAEFQSNSVSSVTNAFNDRNAIPSIALAGDRLFDVVSVPIIVSRHVAGVITFANEIGDKVASDFSKLTGSEIVFLANDHVVASTLRSEEQKKQFQEYLLHNVSAISPQSKQASKILLANEHFLWRANHFQTEQGASNFNYVLLSSYEDSWRMLQQTQQLLFWVRLAGLAFAVLIMWLLIRRVTQPLRELRDGAEAVGRGDFSHRVEVASHDECGELAKSFNQMTENVKTSREQLEKTVETLKTTRAQLVQSEKLSGIGEFVAGVAHELNNPLTAVIGFAELLQQSDVDEKHRKFSQRIVQGAERCHKIVQNLLSFARQHTPERKSTNLNAVVDSVIDILQYELRTSNIEVKKELQPNLPCLMADGHQLQQVFLNILNNARQAMEGRSNSRVKVLTRKAGDRVEVVFQDNGPGISEENVKKIFNPFFTTKPVGKGTGLGLSLSYGIIQEHGGNISVQSKLGEGTAFTIDLPASEQADVSITNDVSLLDTKSKSGERVLVIDDEEFLLELTEEILNSNGYNVDTVSNGEQGLERLKQNHYDIVLCDWKMPGLNGQQVYEHLLAANPRVAERFVFMTADVMSEKTVQFLKDHGRICLAKPFSVQEFSSVLKKFSQDGSSV
jgi:two-component system NtrC family sensor kinase